MIPFINGIRHAWGSVKVNILGRTVSGITAISYEEKQDKVNNYGAGIFPVSRGLGKYEASAKITLHSYEVDAIVKSVGIGKRLVDIAPFDIFVTFMPEGSDQLINHVIRNCEFTSNKRELKTGDTVIETEFDLIVTHIEWA
jgi:hypothetical protein